MTIISSDHENEMQYFRNHLPCPRLLKMIRRIRLFNPPVKGTPNTDQYLHKQGVALCSTSPPPFLESLVDQNII